jgi:hypothetical protein
MVHHDLHRGVGRQQLLFNDEDYIAFERITFVRNIAETFEKREMRAQYVNEPATEAELAGIRRSCRRGTPYGSKTWVETTARKLGLQSTLRNPGRPKKSKTGPVPVSVLSPFPSPVSVPPFRLEPWFKARLFLLPERVTKK